MISLLKEGSFNLRKWAPNAPELLQYIQKKKKYRDMSFPISLHEDDICWHPGHDTFEYEITLKENKQPPIKRQLLSDVSSLFDPLACSLQT